MNRLIALQTKWAAITSLCIAWLLAGCASTAARLPAIPDWQGKDGRFGVSMYVVVDHKGLLQRWASPTEPFDLASLSSEQAIAKEVPAHVVLFFIGCPVTGSGHCDLRADLVIRRPDGSEYGRAMDRRMWSEQAPPAELFRLALPYFMFVADTDDPIGPYQFDVTIRDPNTSSAITVTRTVVISEAHR